MFPTYPYSDLNATVVTNDSSDSSTAKLEHLFLQRNERIKNWCLKHHGKYPEALDWKEYKRDHRSKLLPEDNRFVKFHISSVVS